MAIGCFLFCLLPFFPQFAAHDLPVVQLSLAPPPNQNPELALLIGRLEEKRELMEEGAMGSLEKQLRISLASLQQGIKNAIAEAGRFPDSMLGRCSNAVARPLPSGNARLPGNCVRKACGAKCILRISFCRPSFLAKEQSVPGEKLHVRVAVRASKAAAPDSDMQQQILDLERKRETHERSFLEAQSFQARHARVNSCALACPLVHSSG